MANVSQEATSRHQGSWGASARAISSLAKRGDEVCRSVCGDGLEPREKTEQSRGWGGNWRDRGSVCNGMEINEVRENEMEIYRCATQENLAETRLSSNLLGE